MVARHHIRPFNRAGEDVLHQVVTISEAARLWGYHPDTLRNAIDTGRVNARKSAGTWLISTASLMVRYGPPQKS